ncbi:MAG: hypothetical protein SGPRY_014445, partial [Prymnesium sp.]
TEEKENLADLGFETSTFETLALDFQQANQPPPLLTLLSAMATTPLTLPPKWYPPHEVLAPRVASPFKEPRVIESLSGNLNTTLDLGWVQFHAPGQSFITRALNRSIPANAPERPDSSHLHFHGLHGSSVLPGDDVTLPVGPRGEFTYLIRIPPDHMPGTFWVHPHVHGSSTLQIGAGAAATLLIQDPPGYLPATVEAARDLVWMIQFFASTLQWNIARASGDETFAIFGEEEQNNGGEATRIRDLWLVNGLHSPVLRAAPGEWMRWRLIYSGLRDIPGLALDLTLEGRISAACEKQLLAKDGIYLTDFPRLIDTARVPAGGRADVMVRCSLPGQVDVMAADSPLATLIIDGGVVNSSNMQDWTPERPAYLQDLMGAMPKCSCLTWFGACHDPMLLGERCVNGRSFSASTHMHLSVLGDVQERRVSGIRSHPYHQHMHPFQLISGFTDTPYFKQGDWHDTWQDNTLAANEVVTLRFRPLTYSGRMMVHCHWNQHQDAGMMASEGIFAVPFNGSSCAFH